MLPSSPYKMLHSRLLYITLFFITLFAKAAVLVYLLSAGKCDLVNWNTLQEYIQTRRNRVFRQLMFALITFRISKHMLKRSVVSFLLFTIVVIKLLSIHVKLVKLARSLRPFNGPMRLMACIILSGAFFYLKLVVEVSWAIYYLIKLYRNPSLKDTCALLLGLLHLLDWK